MSIQVSEIQRRVLSALDAEGSDRYTFDQDIKPNLNSAIEILVTWFNQAFADNKLTPENLREITYVKVWKASYYSRVAFNSTAVGHEMWTLTGVYPKPKVNKKIFTSPKETEVTSSFLPDVIYISSDNSAKRMGNEQWNEMKKNSLMAGNVLLKGELAEYAYLDFANYGAGEPEITISPEIPNELVAMAYLKYPTPVTSESGTVEFPKSLTELITEITLNKISMKQGDSTNLWGTSASNINRLVSLIK